MTAFLLKSYICKITYNLNFTVIKYLQGQNFCCLRSKCTRILFFFKCDVLTSEFHKISLWHIVGSVVNSKWRKKILNSKFKTNNYWMDSIPVIYQCQNIIMAMILQTLKHLILCVHRPNESYFPWHIEASLTWRKPEATSIKIFLHVRYVP